MRIAALLLLLGTAWAGPPKYPNCVKDAKTAVEIARTRGKLIFLTVMVDHDGENRMVIDAVFRYKPFLKISSEFVCVLANPEDDHGKVAARGKDGKRVQRCADCPAITCLDHMMLAQNWARAFFPDNDARTPIHFVINGEEDVVHTIMNGDFETGFNHVEGKVVVKELQKMLKKYGRGLSELEYKAMLSNLASARAARARRNVTLEIQRLLEVVALNRKIEGVEQARRRIKEIDALAARERKPAEEKIAAKEWEAALDLLAKITKTYAGTLTAGAADARRKELLQVKEVKHLLKVRGWYERAMSYRQRGKTALARKKFEQCVRLGKDSKYAKLAKKELDAMGGS